MSEAPKPGLHRHKDGLSATLFSAHAEAVTLCLFADDLETEHARVPLVRGAEGWWSATVTNAPESFAYGYRVDGPYEPAAGHRFNANKLLADPYARALKGTLINDPALFGFTDFETGDGFSALDSAAFVPKGWFEGQGEGDGFATPRAWTRPNTRWRDTVIYETHLKGFSKQHPTVSIDAQGTFQAYAGPDNPLVAYLADLGVTAAEFLPLMAFYDERHLGPLGLTNYWGYNPLHFFVPTDRYNADGDPVAAVQAMVEGFHAAGLEVLHDVVFNHTAESDHLGPTLSFRGLDNASYYHLEPGNPARYFNPTGTGNALNGGHPAVQRLVLDALAYWHHALGFDGFRFDLASTLARDAQGKMQSPPSSLIGLIDTDPRLAGAKLIAEPWDIGEDGYQLGQFDGRWTEWNDRFRDGARALWHPAHRSGALQRFADHLLGSATSFDRPLQSINFIAAHDGFTLADMVAFDHKHNEANGEQNRDGHGHNLSWNHGVEGPTVSPSILAERARTQRALLLTLLLSQGVPMLAMGDEQGHSQDGNNNAYCQDGPLSWLEWSDGDAGLAAFVRDALALVRRLPSLRQARHLHRAEHVSWWRTDALQMRAPDWENDDLCALVMHLAPVTDTDPAVAIALNIGDADCPLQLPNGPDWSLALSSADGGSVEQLPRRSIAVFQSAQD